MSYTPGPWRIHEGREIWADGCRVATANGFPMIDAPFGDDVNEEQTEHGFGWCRFHEWALQADTSKEPRKRKVVPVKKTGHVVGVGE